MITEATRKIALPLSVCLLALLACHLDAMLSLVCHQSFREIRTKSPDVGYMMELGSSNGIVHSY